MATVIQNTIGTGGDYSSIQAWEDAAPADLVAADQIWEGLCLNETFASAATIIIAGSTTNGSCYKHLTAQAGESFADQVGQPLRIIPGNGALIQKTSMYQRALDVSEKYARVSRLQIWASVVSTEAVQAYAENVSVFDCILQSVTREAYKAVYTGNVGYNLLLISTGTTGDAVYCGQNATLYDSTIIRTTATPTGTALVGAYGSTTFRNLAIFNFATLASGSTNRTYLNCFTDLSGVPAGLTTVPYDTTTGSGFVNISAGTEDFKLNPTSALVDSGVLFPPYTDFDIYGTPRGATPDVGAYEIAGPPVGVDHATDGDIIGNPADVTGTATLTEPVTVHQATGAVTGLTSNVTGTAKRFLLHTTSGDVVDSTDATVTGQAELINAVYLHETEGVLTGQLGTVVGTARRFRTHPTDGILLGDLADVVGLAEIVSPPGEHETYGALSGQHGTVVGTAKHLRKHVTTGALAGRTAVVTGEAVKFAEHDTSGIIVGYDAKVVGSATNVGSLTLTPADIAAIVAAIKAEIIPVDIVRVNHIAVDGTGSPGDEWGPV